VPLTQPPFYPKRCAVRAAFAPQGGATAPGSPLPCGLLGAAWKTNKLFNSGAVLGEKERQFLLFVRYSVRCSPAIVHSWCGGHRRRPCPLCSVASVPKVFSGWLWLVLCRRFGVWRWPQSLWIRWLCQREPPGELGGGPHAVPAVRERGCLLQQRLVLLQTALLGRAVWEEEAAEGTRNGDASKETVGTTRHWRGSSKH